MNQTATQNIHPRAAFAHRDFRFYLSARFLSLCAHQMMAVAISQYIYEITHSALYLGYIGLAIFLPKCIFTLPAGHIADRYPKRHVILICRTIQMFASVGVALAVALETQSLLIIYTLLVIIGSAYSFDGPSSHSIVPELVPDVHFGNAVAWNSSNMQLAFIAGPALGGLLYPFGKNGLMVFVIIAIIRFISSLLIAQVKPAKPVENPQPLSWETLIAGVKYVFRTRIILGIISLDLFAVLLGGAVALLPIFANDILKVGAEGLGFLRAAPALGAALMAIGMAHLPPLKKAGPTLLVCVSVFGLLTIIFALSKSFILSLVVLFLLGAADMISVVIRGILVQVKTPHAMRGRVSAVNMIFIGASNELGEFESGVTAAWWGVIPATIVGGVGTLVVGVLWAYLFPEIRKYGEIQSGP